MFKNNLEKFGGFLGSFYHGVLRVGACSSELSRITTTTYTSFIEQVAH